METVTTAAAAAPTGTLGAAAPGRLGTEGVREVTVLT